MNDRHPLDRVGRMLVVGEVVSGVCVVGAVWAVRGGWEAIGSFGLGLFAVCQLIDRRTRPG